MIITVKKEICSIRDDHPMKLITEASTAGLRPGEWPDYVFLQDEEHVRLLKLEEIGSEGYSYKGVNVSIWELLILND